MAPGATSLPEASRDEVAAGLRYTHTRASANTGKLLEVASFAYAAIELLAEKGLLQIAELDKRKAVVPERLVKKYTEDGLGAAYQDPEHENYSFEKVVNISVLGVRRNICAASALHDGCSWPKTRRSPRACLKTRCACHNCVAR
jgi:hypothetical protein